MTDPRVEQEPRPPRRRRVVVVEYDVTRLTSEQVDALLLHALVEDQDVSFRIAEMF